MDAPLPHRDPPQLDGTTPDEEHRLRISLARTLTLGLTALFAASLGTSLWIAFDAAQQNTFDLERALAELTVESVIQEVDTHIGAAQKQVEFLSRLIARGEVGIDDEQRLTDLMVGAMAAAPQVSGIALVRADYTVLRDGLGTTYTRAHYDTWKANYGRTVDSPTPEPGALVLLLLGAVAVVVCTRRSRA